MNVEDIVRAHAGERLAVPLAEIERRAGRRPARRRVYAGVAVATAAAAAAVVGFGVLRSGPELAPGAVDLGTFCAEAAVAPLPPWRFQHWEGDREMMVYASSAEVVTCRFDGIATTRPGDEGWGPVLNPLVMQPEFPLTWIIGMVPPGTERVEATLPSGRVVQAVLNGEFYLASWVDENGPPTRIVAFTADRIYTYEKAETTSRPR